VGGWMDGWMDVEIGGGGVEFTRRPLLTNSKLG